MFILGSGNPGGFRIWGGELKVIGGGGGPVVRAERAIFVWGGVASFRWGDSPPPPKRASRKPWGLTTVCISTKNVECMNFLYDFKALYYC